MSTTGWIVIAVIIGVALWVMGVYNSLVALGQRVSQAFADIDVQLRQRHDLIPNLVETVKGYATHERGTLEAVVQARNSAVNAQGQDAKVAAETQLSGALGKLFALAEAYPDLKANTTFLEFQDALQKVEDELQLARRYYNGTARNLNTAIQQFPSSIIAGIFHFATVQYFEIDNAADRAVPTVKFS
jgi:LemA protein